MSEEFRKQILCSARQLIGRNGFSNLSISKVAHAAKISKSQVYYYFESKFDLVSQMIDEQIEEYMQIRNFIDEVETISEKIEILFSYIQNQMGGENNVYTNGSMLLRFAVETQSDEPTLNEKNRSLGNLIFDDIYFLIQASNVFSKNEEETDYARKVLAMILGALVMDQVLDTQADIKFIKDDLISKLTV